MTSRSCLVAVLKGLGIRPCVVFFDSQQALSFTWKLFDSPLHLDNSDTSCILCLYRSHHPSAVPLCIVHEFAAIVALIMPFFVENLFGF